MNEKVKSTYVVYSTVRSPGGAGLGWGGRMENIKKQLGLFLSSSTYLLTEECNVSTWPCIRITWGRLKDETHCYQ